MRHVFFAIFSFFSISLFAQEQDYQQDEYYVGIYSGLTPRFLGSKDLTLTAQPIFEIKDGRFDLSDTGFKYHFLNRNNYDFGIIANPDWGRTDHNVNNPYSSGSNTLHGTQKIGATLEMGFFGFYRPLSFLPLLASARKSPDQWGHGGAVVDFGLYAPIQITDDFDITALAIFTWTDGRYMRSYFSVGPNASANSGKAVYNARAGIRNFAIDIHPRLRLTQRWYAGLEYGYAKLLGDAAKSPIVESTNNSLYEASIECHF